MKNIFLFTATLKEANPFFALAQDICEQFHNKIKIRTFDYKKYKIHIIITGVGHKKTKTTISKISDLIYSGYIINFGLAGALKQNLKIGEWKKITSCLHENHSLIINNSNQQSLAIATVKKCVSSEKEKETLREKYNADIVDMEAYFIANLAKQKNLPCKIIKMISDLANENTKQSFNNSMKKYEAEATNFLIELIKNEK